MQHARIDINNEPPTIPSIPSMKFIKLIIAVKINQSHKLHIAVDCANGALSEIISEIKWPANIRLMIMNNSPNGTNINNA